MGDARGGPHRFDRGSRLCPTARHSPAPRGAKELDHGSPGVDQLALATLIESGSYDRHLRLYPVSDVRTGGGDHPPDLVLGFGNLSEAAIERGIAAIADLLAAP